MKYLYSLYDKERDNEMALFEEATTQQRSA